MNSRLGQRTVMTARSVACAVALVALFSVVCSLALAPASWAAAPPQVQPVASVVQGTAPAPAVTEPCRTKSWSTSH